MLKGIHAGAHNNANTLHTAYRIPANYRGTHA